MGDWEPLLVAAAVLGPASCEDGGTGPGTPDAGEFRAAVSGQVDADFSGTARRRSPCGPAAF